MKHIKVYEGDWWDNDPNAPWNQDDIEPREDREIDYKDSDLKFECVSLPQGGSVAILKAKPGVEPSGLWVINIEEVDEDYKLKLSYGEDDDPEYELDEVAVVNYATDIYNDPQDSMSAEDWLDGSSWLTPLSSPEVRDEAISLLEYSLKPGYGRAFTADKSKTDSIKMAIHILDGIKFDDETPY
jgi:hypothetical protein